MAVSPASGKLYLSGAHTLYAVDGLAGAFAWNSTVGYSFLNPPAVAPVAGDQEAVFVTTYDGVLYEFAA